MMSIIKTYKCRLAREGLQNLFTQQYSKIGNTTEQLFHVQIIEVFKNTLPTKLYWILFPIEDLRKVVETAKRILTKEKLDRQLTRQTLVTPFMSIRDGHYRKISFDAKEELCDKIDKLLVMVGKLATRDGRTN